MFKKIKKMRSFRLTEDTSYNLLHVSMMIKESQASIIDEMASALFYTLKFDDDKYINRFMLSCKERRDFYYDKDELDLLE